VAKQDVEALERQFNAAMEEADTGSALDAARRIYAEFDREGTEATAGLLHARFELHMETLFLDGKVYKGAKGFARWREEMEELFEEDSFEPQGIRFGATGFVVLGRLRVKGKKSGVEVDEPIAHYHEQRDGKLVRLTIYSDIDQALRDADIQH
jgi:ketosteroid isomerase-like protein